LPPEDQNEQQARPSWVTDELLEKTVKVWSRVSGRLVTREEAMAILLNVSRLIECACPLTG
jgi:hypothetical protein